MVDERVLAIFKGLTPEELDVIMRCCETITVKRGEQVFKAGEPAHSLFLVLSGTIELRFKAAYYAGALEIPLEAVGANGACGWSAMVPPYSYTLSAHATEDSKLLRIRQTDLQDCCEADTRLGYVVMKNIAQIVGARYELALKMLIGEIQTGLKEKDPLA